jgi:mono/diheme cytochrome c family protein
MIRLIAWCVTLVGIVLAAGCGAGGSGGSPTPDATPTSPYDNGPRAGEAPVAAALAAKGELLFKSKGCSACHAFGQRLTCPDQKGVTTRRTAQWIEQQILHPEIMTKEDPIAKKLLAEYVQQMPNQGVTPEEARAIIEFLKKKDHELGVIP